MWYKFYAVSQKKITVNSVQSLELATYINYANINNSMLCMHGHGSASFYHCDVLFKYGHQNLLPTQKIHFTHLQQYDENHCTYHARIGRHSKKKLAET